VVGLSRKRFLGALTGRAVEDRLAGSLAALTFCILRGAHVMRVHDVKESRDALRVAAALKGIDGVLE
jgi:dihydropteroate synthase